MTNTPDPDQGMNINQVAELWGVSRRTVRRKVADGSLPMFKVGRATRFRREDVVNFAAAQTAR